MAGSAGCGRVARKGSRLPGGASVKRLGPSLKICIPMCPQRFKHFVTKRIPKVLHTHAAWETGNGHWEISHGGAGVGALMAWHTSTRISGHRTKPGRRVQGSKNQPMIMYTHSAPTGPESRLFFFLAFSTSLVRLPRLPIFWSSASHDYHIFGILSRRRAHHALLPSRCGQWPWIQEDWESEIRDVLGCVVAWLRFSCTPFSLALASGLGIPEAGQAA